MSDRTGSPSGGRLRAAPPPPPDFDPLTATSHDLLRHGLPRRPDPQTEPDLAALWEKKAQQYRGFTHLPPSAHPVADPDTHAPTATDTHAASDTHTDPDSHTHAPMDSTTRTHADPDTRVDTHATQPFAPNASDSCGYSLTSDSGHFTSLFITCTVPDLQFDGDPFAINSLHTYFGLGLLDVHVQLTVNSSQSVTCELQASAVGTIALPLRPGDVLSASLCLNTNPAGTAAYFFTNETTGQMMSFSVDTGFPPAVIVNAGVTRDGVMRPGQSLARFGTVYFDEISAYNSGGRRSLPSGQKTSMVDWTGTVLATADALTDYTFKVISNH